MSTFITEEGNLVEAPKYTAAEGDKKAYARVPVIVEYRGKARDGGGYETVGRQRYNLTVFGQLAENLQAQVEGAASPGKVRVVFAGELTIREYERAGDAGTGYSHDVVVDKLGVSLLFTSY